MRIVWLGLLVALFLSPALAEETGSTPLSPLAPEAFTKAHAAHLLRRAGFGGSEADVRALHARGLHGAVSHLVDYESIPSGGAAPLEITLRDRPNRQTYAGKSDEERRKIRQMHRREDTRQHRRVKEWWVRRMITTPRPLEERMTLFWHGHFTSGYRTVRNSYHMYVQNATLRGLATSSFRSLLHEISRDPAMLRYLDGNRNRKGRPNENFAREVMELFTLGEGNYTERDIKEAARAFTGWTFSGNRFRFVSRQHDDGEKTFRGETGPLDGSDVLELLLADPQVSRHLARKLFTYFVHEDPSEEALDALSASIREHDYALKPVLRTLFASRAFYAPDAQAAAVKSPVDLVVSLFRTLEIRPPERLPLARLTTLLGQDLLDPPNVKGWDGGRDWITTSHLLNRYNVASALVGQAADAAILRRLGARPRLPAAAASRPFLFDAAAFVAARGLETPEAIVDHFTALLLAGEASPAVRRTLIAYLADGGDSAGDPEARRDRLHGLLRLLVSTPAFQLK